MADLGRKAYPIGGVIASPFARRGLSSTGDAQIVAGSKASRVVCLEEKNMMAVKRASGKEYFTYSNDIYLLYGHLKYNSTEIAFNRPRLPQEGSLDASFTLQTCRSKDSSMNDPGRLSVEAM